MFWRETTKAKSPQPFALFLSFYDANGHHLYSNTGRATWDIIVSVVAKGRGKSRPRP